MFLSASSAEVRKVQPHKLENKTVQAENHFCIELKTVPQVTVQCISIVLQAKTSVVNWAWEDFAYTLGSLAYRVGFCLYLQGYKSSFIFSSTQEKASLAINTELVRTGEDFS